MASLAGAVQLLVVTQLVVSALTLFLTMEACSCFCFADPILHINPRPYSPRRCRGPLRYINTRRGTLKLNNLEALLVIELQQRRARYEVDDNISKASDSRFDHSTRIYLISLSENFCWNPTTCKNLLGDRSMGHDVLEHILDVLEHILDGTEEPTNLPFELLKNITGNFSEEREIGHGGFGIVYKGVLRNGIVAVKRIFSHHTINERLFYREVNSLLNVNHENVVRFLGYCACTEEKAMRIEGVREYIYAEIRERLLCFEYISNGSLREYIIDELRGLEWNTRYQIIKQICHGLHYLHKERHILHMDLKPDNILLDNNMVAKISDFGLSRLDEKSQTMEAKRCVTLGYCSPEYLLGGKMSVKSDMYSLGVIIIELVTGYKDIPHNNNVLRRWRHRWNKSLKEIPWSYQKLQITKCIEIGLHCQESDPYRRPFIWDVIHDIYRIEGTFGQNHNADGFYVDRIRPCWDDDMLDIEPLKLHFQFELNKKISCLLHLTNGTTASIAFAIQSVSQMPYCIQPNKGIVLPLSSCAIVITLQSQSKPPKDMQHLGEFVVRSAKVIDGVTPEEITLDMFNRVSGEVVDEVIMDAFFDMPLLLEET